MPQLPTTPSEPRLSRRTLVAAGLASALAACAGPSHAFGRHVGLELVDRETGEPLQVWWHRGRRYVAGRPGARYAIRLVNRSTARVLVVVAVDGVNVISGQTAAWGQTGYVLAPWQSYDLTGWRKSDHEVAAFEFTSLPGSYAARTGRPLDVGVIGVAVFRERPPPYLPPPAPPVAATEPADRRADAEGAGAPAPSATAADRTREKSALARQERSRLGTGHGEREVSEVRHTAFERESTTPAEILSVQYDRRENLVAAGIVPPERPVAARPRPFPGSRENEGYAPDPWR